MPSSPPSYLPLTHLSFQILLALMAGPQHGYAIVKAVQESPTHPSSPGTGTFYSAIRRMLDDGLLEEAPAPEDADARRRYYAITALGKAALRGETLRLEALVRTARAVQTTLGAES